jgi:hypothetical protein
VVYGEMTVNTRCLVIVLAKSYYVCLKAIFCLSSHLKKNVKRSCKGKLFDDDNSGKLHMFEIL